jgi:hypothetical protein
MRYLRPHPHFLGAISQRAGKKQFPKADKEIHKFFEELKL